MFPASHDHYSENEQATCLSLHTRTHKHVHLAASHCSVKPLLIVKQELDNGLQSWPVYQTPYTFCSPVRTTINSPQLDFTPPPLWHLG